MVFSNAEKCDMLETYFSYIKYSSYVREYYNQLYSDRIQPQDQYFWGCTEIQKRWDCFC